MDFLKGVFYGVRIFEGLLFFKWIFFFFSVGFFLKMLFGFFLNVCWIWLIFGVFYGVFVLVLWDLSLMIFFLFFLKRLLWFFFWVLEFVDLFYGYFDCGNVDFCGDVDIFYLFLLCMEDLKFFVFDKLDEWFGFIVDWGDDVFLILNFLLVFRFRIS